MLEVRRILAPIDDTALADKVLDHAVTIAERFGAHLYVLYVRHETRPQTEDDQARDEAEFDAEYEAVRQTALGRIKRGHSLPPDHVHAEVLTGDPLDGILISAKDHAVDLIVMGTHGPQNLMHRLFGTVTSKVLAQSTASLWVVREDPPPVG